MKRDVFVPNLDYLEYLERDLNFEDYCYRSAIEKKCLHSYAYADKMSVWFNMTFLPLEVDDEELGYCIYLMEFSTEASTEKMSNISGDIAASVLETCIRLRGTNDFRATMQDVVHGIGELCAAEHCCVLVMEEMERDCYVLAENLSENTPLLPMDNYVNKDFYDIAESWVATIAGSNCLIAKDEQDMLLIEERNPVWYESLTSAGARNIVLFPLKSRNQLLGFMWAINFDASRSIKIKETLEVTTFILGSELGNYLLLDRLRVLSSKDMLTGVMNRNEMNNYVEALSSGEKYSDSPVGVLFIDMNGLKRINDSHGHTAGDITLKKAAEVLRKVFDEKEIYRAGGDEFTVIVKDITQEELSDKILQIKEFSKEYDNLSFAIGGCVEKNCRNVRMALRIADERMYEDKWRFYENNPDGLLMERYGLRDIKRAAIERSEIADITETDRDYLTGLLNMNAFLRFAEHYRKIMHQRDSEIAVVFFNLSGMKSFNKKYGFSEGDILIKIMAEILAQEFGSDQSSRFGQDHFAVFTERKGLEAKLKNVFLEMKRANNGKTLNVRAGVYPDSMGIVESSLACDRAKAACNIHKDENRSYYWFYDKTMLERELRKQYVIDNLDRAIDENWITAYYQPIVRGTNRRVSDEEALARWIDPEKGMLSPAEFIPILEESKLIYKVDLRMVDIILEKLKNQKKAGLLLVPNSVNLSRTDFEVIDIVEEITNRVDAAGIPRKLLTIEITESIIGENFEFMKAQIERFQMLGFKVWMDDFGSGYSSLDLLQEIHFDVIKFDMRFMRQFNQKPESRVILRELVRMANALNSETVAEGVETAEQVEFLCEIGCTKMQGFYYCKPIPMAKILERYRTGTQIGFENQTEEI
jgi:diguanylate cyclase (GGDEF)-like protein